MLSAMDEYRSLFRDASPDAICPLDLLRPDAAEPDPPTFELFGPRFVTTMMDSNSTVVAQKNDIPLLPDDGIQPIDLLPSIHDYVSQRFRRDA